MTEALITAQNFLSDSFNQLEDKKKLNRFYLYVLTFNIDKHFIVDLNKIKVRLLSAPAVLAEILEFSRFAAKKTENKDLNSCFINYLVS